MDFDQELEVLLKARFALVFVKTTEESRVLDQIRKMCARTERSLLTWDIADGFEAFTGGIKTLPAGPSAVAALEAIEKWAFDSLFVLKDFDDCWSTAQIRRKLKNVVSKLRQTRKSIVIIGSTNQIPEQLKDDVFLVDFSLPAAADIEQVLRGMSQVPGASIRLSERGREKLVRAALGLSAAQATRVFSKALVCDGVLDDRHIEMVTEEKRQVIRESQSLEFLPVSETVDDLGGFDMLKEWLGLRERAFTEDAKKYMLPVPKGILLLGIPGTGKGLAAKTIGGAWHMPILRLDIGSLFSNLVGETEEHTRKALHLAEAISPCVLWIDELEKAFTPGDIDRGASRRALSTVLTWMQEKQKPCFVVATANDAHALPAELLRRGTFDEIFFLDLPTIKERREIFAVHLTKRKRLIRDFDIDQLADSSEGYVGAEIEQAIISGMYIGFDQRREFTTADVLAALHRQIPLSVSQSDSIEELRKLLIDGKIQSASFRETAEAQDAFVNPTKRRIHLLS